MKFYRCSHCGQIATKEVDKNVKLFCCGSPMEELVANTSDGAGEKHVPAVRQEGNKVCVFVGDVEHPMLDVHYIQFIAIETNLGHHVKELKPGQKPYAEFLLADGEELIKTYEYCNLHSLWSK
jgi:superoxide reductase